MTEVGRIKTIVVSCDQPSIFLVALVNYRLSVEKVRVYRSKTRICIDYWQLKVKMTPDEAVLELCNNLVPMSFIHRID